jgi:hypothetical protein
MARNVNSYEPTIGDQRGGGWVGGVMLPRYFLLQHFAKVNGENHANVCVYFTKVSISMSLLVLIFLLNPLIKNKLEYSDFQFLQVQTV